MAACRSVCITYSARKHLLLGYCFPKLYSTELASSKVNEGGKCEKKIVIPLRIKRGPTDILKALATTVSKDYTAAHYKYHDDPYLIPVSNHFKSHLALSKESGKRTARNCLNKYPEFFKCNTSVPHIQAFDPPVTYSEEDDLDEKVLENCVKSHNLSDSINVYNILKKKDISVSQGTKQILLELVCFFNETLPPPPVIETPCENETSFENASPLINEDYPEQRWFMLTGGKRKNTWKNNKMAEQLFNEMDKDSAAYCAMILGTAKYNDVQKAFELYEEMRSKNLPASLGVYNSLLTLVPLYKENGDAQWDFAMELVSNMNREGLFPNLYTMNALLSVISDRKNVRWDKGRAIAPQVLAEMKRLDIEPSLGSYYHILKTYFTHDVAYPSVFADILAKVDGREFEIQHPDDMMFFNYAMEVCYKHLNDIGLAYRIHALLETGRNHVFIGNGINYAQYYRNLTKLLCENEDFEKFMEFYNKYVPNVYTPELSVMHEIVLAAELLGAYHHLPRFGSDIIMFEYTNKKTLITDFVRIAGSIKHSEEIQKPLVEVVWKIKELIDEDIQLATERGKMIRMVWTGIMLGDIMKVFLNGENLEKAKHVLLHLKSNESSNIGYPENEVLIQFCSACLEAKDFIGVKICVQYAVDSYYPDIRSDLRPVVEDLLKSGKLSEADRSAVNAMIEVTDSEDMTVQNVENYNESENMSSSS